MTLILDVSVMTNKIQELTQNGNDNHHSQKTYDHQKIVMIENIIDTTALIIDVIWNKFFISLNSQVIPLRLFIQETIRRSRTSWSTLQTALFYLLRIKPKIATLEVEITDNKSDPATCGRRMFLASLIIASKYLQDRNYANSAWSKICGLHVKEINAIERRFLILIDYNLFIKDNIFNNWTNFLRSRICTFSGLKQKGLFSKDEDQRAIAQFVECQV
ncbi:14219_t:CDS:2 [Cetraspora pellucida]|uniref:14219_t:CDS:1 n=1 Tax=Cetraspora pellucida TaxID=1433469 RepID=A0A9N9GN53_9GLOM|nr:14219_t:CDS:2 [Cetraspora pellucida]